MVEPSKRVLARNLFAKDNERAALADEFVPRGPEVSLICEAVTAAGVAERLTGATPGPHGAGVEPSGEAQCARPPADAGEEVTLVESAQIAVTDIKDASVINFPRCDMSDCD
jgi:hypothetical protein